MLDKPPIPDSAIIAHLSDHYGLSIHSIEFLPIGYDSNASVYRVDTPDALYFLKLKRAFFDPISATVPHALRSAGIPEVVAPIPTLSSTLWSTLDAYTVLLYPFIDGANGMNTTMTPDHWVTFGQILKRIHSAILPPDLIRSLPREAFDASPRHQHMIRDLHTHIAHHPHTHPAEREAAAFWQSQATEIDLIVTRTIDLGLRLRDRHPALTLCHADIHTGNLLIDSSDGLHIVDWDQPILAPIERDLMFIAGLDLQRMSIGSESAAPFFEGYGTTPIDSLALTYYRYERVMEDIAEFAHSLFLDPTASDATKSDSLYYLRIQFAPDDMLAAAHTLYSTLSL